MADNKKYLILTDSERKLETITKFLEPILTKANWKLFYVKPDSFPLKTKKTEMFFEPSGEPVFEEDKALHNLKISLMKADKVFICTNPDNEGEALAYHLQNLVLKHSEAAINRMHLEALTQEELFLYLKAAEKVDIDTAKAVIARNAINKFIELDYRVAVKRTGNITEVKNRYVPINLDVIGILHLMVEQERKRRTFLETKTFSIECEICEGKAKALSALRFLTKESTVEHIEKIRRAEDNFTLEVDFVQKQKILENQKPFITRTLLQYCNRKYGYQPTEVLEKLFYLYEQGLITYPITDRVSLNRQFSQQVWLHARQEELQIKKEYQNYFDKGVGEVIRPTKIIKPEDCEIKDPIAETLYRVIWERTINTQLKPTVITVQEADYTIDDGETLLMQTSGLIVNNQGPRKVKEKQVLEQKTLKNLGDMSIVEVITKPPQYYTIDSLIKDLHKNNIWDTENTIKAIDAMVVDRYIVLEEDKLILTRRGEFILEIILKLNPNLDLISIAQFKEDIEDIKNRKVDYLDIINEYKNTLKLRYVNSVRMDYPTECPQCMSKLNGKMDFFLKDPYVKCTKCDWWNYIDFDSDGNLRISAQYQKL